MPILHLHTSTTDDNMLILHRYQGLARLGSKFAARADLGPVSVEHPRKGQTRQGQEGRYGTCPLIAQLLVHLSGEEWERGAEDGTEQGVGREYGGSVHGVYIAVSVFSCMLTAVERDEGRTRVHQIAQEGYEHHNQPAREQGGSHDRRNPMYRRLGRPRKQEQTNRQHPSTDHGQA